MLALALARRAAAPPTLRVPATTFTASLRPQWTTQRLAAQFATRRGNLMTQACRRPKSSVAIQAPAFEAAAESAATSSSRAVAGRFTELVTPGYETKVGLWLVGTCGMLYSMIAIGGYTRLSGSGLSMTDWRIEGRSLPGTREAWEREFEEYKRYPEYQRLHAGNMELDEFKRIYFVEWFHRMWGRTAGVLFAIPLTYFMARRVLRARLALRLTGLFGLGLSQAFVGWWMVRSGFDSPEKHTPMAGAHQRPRVSPYRLASHWTAALTIYCGCVWSALDMLRPSPAVIHGTSAECIRAAARLRRAVLPAAALVGLTLLSGPFVAGNDAGHAYNTWPKMLDDWIPPEWIEAVSSPLSRWRLFFEDTAVVQFDHRCLAYASVLATLGAYGYAMTLPVSPAVASVTALLPVAVGAQMCLGIATLMLYVPIELGVAHQAGGVAVLTVLLLSLHTLRLPAVAAAAVL
eukprot:TRINITY_DN45979_c0_g1_i1.p1 TRINITY_DN45979_c0_g1~~TRINITY_DN45979_c0_g1_i1.p1  ORF type:complete len:461 (+),score=78.71 TRINITY_DN45979_c0_g1_i1:91-1473(+)